MKSQSAKILHVLQSGKPVTPLIALRRFGCLRLAARINDLKAEGHKIQSRMMERNGKRFAAYWMG